ncbi:uncharacterized protein N7479_006655 [Penicillium vulpinum]|uniref:uncharacterized protein n=1 Tax=Penicillium vulpinum TaxID=29845 RepID=UPI00254792EB|nr:uncharacterized protein N7479_006655 [Penicillium vulpinum]KAJ5959505.1 hypothetical protein N7479_006655 [Penicillium vulpinum]
MCRYPNPLTKVTEAGPRSNQKAHPKPHQSGVGTGVAKNNIYRLLELQLIGATGLLGQQKETNNFGYVGLVVPDFVEAQTYFEAQRVTVLKRDGETVEDFSGSVRNLTGIVEFAGFQIQQQ